MQKELLNYYDQELKYLREMGQEFARSYPKMASWLATGQNEYPDPHVGQIVQGFALLAAKIHLQLDDDFTKTTNALLGLLYPHYLAPVPSMSIAQFVLDSEQSTSRLFEADTRLDSPSIEGGECRFRTCYPTTVWPIKVRQAEFATSDSSAQSSQAEAVLRLEFQSVPGTTFADLGIDQLRLFLDGATQDVYMLYELLLNHLLEIHVSFPRAGMGGRPYQVLASDCLTPVGFRMTEGLLAYPPHAFLGYRLLQEYFVFPQKFHFVDVSGLDKLDWSQAQDRMDLTFVLNRGPQVQHHVTHDNFRLGCTPIVNLFEAHAAPISFTQTQHEYEVIPGRGLRKSAEVYTIQSVQLTKSGTEEDWIQDIHPIYSLTHGGPVEDHAAYWHMVRRPAKKHDDHGTDVFLSCVDLNVKSISPKGDTLKVKALWTNRDLAHQVRIGDPDGDFNIEGKVGPTKVRALFAPTKTVRPSHSGSSQWKLISHLAVNAGSFAQGGAEALREMLTLYDYSNLPAMQQQIQGVHEVTAKPVTRRLTIQDWQGVCRGMEIAVRFDEEKYRGGSLFLLASVLERFLGIYTSLNSFTQMVALRKNQERPLKRWPPRTGEQSLL